MVGGPSDLMPDGLIWTPRNRRLVTAAWALVPLYGKRGYARVRSVATEGTQGSRRLVATTWALLPLYGKLTYARGRSLAASATRSGRRKLLLTLGGTVAVVYLLAFGHPIWSALLAPIALGAAMARVAGWLERQRRVRAVLHRVHGLDGVAPARQTLLALGLDEATVGRVMAARGEVLLAAFDQNNRVLSDVGPIPYFSDVQIGPEKFHPRGRHRLELVVFRGVVCVKKTYRDRVSFERELLALDAVDGLPGVPRIVQARRFPRIHYQSFLLGRNLGSLMACQGASESIQHRVSMAYWDGDRWHAEPTSPARDVALGALTASIGSAVVARVGELMSAIHRRGVTFCDVKYGNVLVVGDRPFVCDFDRATVFRRNTWQCVREREMDRDLFNYFFGNVLLSERAFRAEAMRLSRLRPELVSARIYYGAGYASQWGGEWRTGSGRWYLLRTHLPALAGKTVLDLGCRDGVTSIEMLRAGARSVIGYEPDPVMAQYARLNRQWFEFVQNRPFDGLEVLDGPITELATRMPGGFDLATAFDGLPGKGPEESAELVRWLSTVAERLVIRARGQDPSGGEGAGRQSTVDNLKDLLLTNGYSEVKVRVSPDGAPVLVGRRAGRLPLSEGALVPTGPRAAVKDNRS